MRQLAGVVRGAILVVLAVPLPVVLLVNLGVPADVVVNAIARRVRAVGEVPMNRMNERH